MPQRLSSVEDTLTYHVRTFLTAHFSNDHIRRLSFICSLITCLVDASVVTFSIFTPQFIAVLGYNQININVIAGAMNCGLYLTLPLLGYLSDAHGSILLALIGMVLCPGYLLAKQVFIDNWNYFYMAVAFFIIGTGTSSAYFCSLLTCAKIYPDRKGLSISLPVSCYGLSSLLLSYIFGLPDFKVHHHISVTKVFTWLAIVYLITGLINCVSSVIVTIEKEIIFEKLHEQEDRQQIPQPADENTSLLSVNMLEPESHSKRFRNFLKDPSMPLFYTMMFFVAGPLELFVSNLGSISNTLGNVQDTEIAKEVAIYSLFSTITRLTVGCLNDLFNSSACTVIMVFISILLSSISFALLAFRFHEIETISALMGICYGSIFTLCPTLTATIWGVDLMGSTWGLFLSAPAIGSLVLGLFYAFEYDKYCAAHVEAMTKYCLTFPFSVFSGCCLLSAFCIIYCYRGHWERSMG